VKWCVKNIRAGETPRVSCSTVTSGVRRWLRRRGDASLLLSLCSLLRSRFGPSCLWWGCPQSCGVILLLNFWWFFVQHLKIRYLLGEGDVKIRHLSYGLAWANSNCDNTSKGGGVARKSVSYKNLLKMLGRGMSNQSCHLCWFTCKWGGVCPRGEFGLNSIFKPLGLSLCGAMHVLLLEWQKAPPEPSQDWAHQKDLCGSLRG